MDYICEKTRYIGPLTPGLWLCTDKKQGSDYVLIINGTVYWETAGLWLCTDNKRDSVLRNSGAKAISW